MADSVPLAMRGDAGAALDRFGIMREGPILAAAVSWCVLESTVSRPPQEKGPMFGVPFSSSKRFHPTMHPVRLRNTWLNVCDQLSSLSHSPARSSRGGFGPVAVFPEKASCTRVMASGVPASQPGRIRRR